MTAGLESQVKSKPFFEPGGGAATRGRKCSGELWSPQNSVSSLGLVPRATMLHSCRRCIL